MTNDTFTDRSTGSPEYHHDRGRSACCFADIVTAKDAAVYVCSYCEHGSDELGEVALERINRLIEEAACRAWNMSGEGRNGEYPITDKDGNVQNQVISEVIAEVQDMYDRHYSLKAQAGL